MSFSLGVIGLGKMAQVILQSSLDKGQFSSEAVIGIVGQSKNVKKVRDQFPKLLVLEANNPRSIEVWDSPVKLLAVKPQQLDQVKEKKPSKFDHKLGNKPLLISILAGIKLSKLQDCFPSHSCVRVIPNIPALVGSGLTGIAWGDEVSSQQRGLVESIFKNIGEVSELPEDQLDAFLALTSSGPAYLALIAEALADGAVAAGLPRNLAHNFTYLTMEGTARLLKQKSLHPGELKDMVASPSGTTIEALRHLEKERIRSAFIEAVVLAAKKSRDFS